MSKKPTKSRMVSLRITEDQFQYLEEFARRIRQETGFHITRASIITKLMEYGVPHLEKEFPKKKGKGNR
ncbi:MAG: hypothetical protein HRU19_14685 [Pseudobacteriovorax sp.]|nr:hypothetical protein [Pseudobacteriovorax sp.]